MLLVHNIARRQQRLSRKKRQIKSSYPSPVTSLCPSGFHSLYNWHHLLGAKRLSVEVCDDTSPSNHSSPYLNTLCSSLHSHFYNKVISSAFRLVMGLSLGASRKTSPSCSYLPCLTARLCVFLCITLFQLCHWLSRSPLYTFIPDHTWLGSPW